MAEAGELFGPGRASRQRLARLAHAAPLTIVVGAGASIESGIPDWRSLVERLLSLAADRLGLNTGEATSFVDWTVQRESLPAAASIARVSLGSETAFRRALRVALYDGRRAFTPGQTAAGVARLRLALAADDGADASEVVTTNYDLLLERAIEEELATGGATPDRTVRTVARPLRQRRGEVVVRHLHGVLPPTGRRAGTVILSDADYHLMQDERAWQEQYFSERLRTSTCIFVGTSLTDPNLLRYLHRQSQGSAEHAVCFARQQDARFYETAPSAVADVRERAVAARWEAVGVHPVLVGNFSETAQFLNELVLMRALGDRYTDLRTRLRSWDSRLRKGVLDTGRRFASRQDDLVDILRALLGYATEFLAGCGEDGGGPFQPTPDERLQCSLWVYRPSDDALVNWASSDRAWRDPATLVPVPIEWDSGFAAVRAYCNGSVVSYSTAEQVATRWNHVVGAPLYLDDDELGRLPIGAFTLASNVPEPDSVLARAMGQVRGHVYDVFHERLVDLLRPTA